MIPRREYGDSLVTRRHNMKDKIGAATEPLITQPILTHRADVGETCFALRPCAWHGDQQENSNESEFHHHLLTPNGGVQPEPR
jgi:hypothetical protein